VGTVLVAYVALCIGCATLGLIVTDWSAAAGVRRWDTSVNRWFVAHGNGALDAASAVGSRLADTMTVIALGLVVATVVWWRRRDLGAVGILAIALVLEVTVFVTTTVVVDRARPPVRHLDAVPPTSSFPSGHTAAAIALYIGLAIIVRRSFQRGPGTTALTVVLALFPVAVALSRLYRGLHAPTDVFAGALLGLLALTIACAAARRASDASASRDRAPLEAGTRT
jgi:membrane-associated phospholipid phosphatase